MKSTMHSLLTLVAIVVGFVSISVAQSPGANPQTGKSSPKIIATKSDFSNIKIGNFGQMDERFFRGAQPLEGDYQALKDLGINTVIDLRNDPMPYEKNAVEALGMKYVNIPMSGWKSPQQKDVDTFLALVSDPATGKFFVHCKAGIHRTGVVGAAYRYTKDDWDYANVYKEMKNYNYSSGLVHGKLGSFVKKWGQRRAEEKAAAGTAASSVVIVLSSPMTASGSSEDN
ncbi:MAG TPA: tyrosine-protein phosphatase [Pyrinomonadaceae bacterium]|nr:tyrosine-protein phosphatase [Pyrinomonadaceae bacterium]